MTEKEKRLEELIKSMQPNANNMIGVLYIQDHTNPWVTLITNQKNIKEKQTLQ